ncbi:hypothetical protein MmiAt1_07380 [Methanimicrococcus sp. At1]|uniref:Uncharacterized protein n=1 Tax=Methanimicrococcus hacksteinii TaxID=3028293 RepID=A0ABU3VP89_9EURY|nr:hypothetical protein [Methanimicrococcus sp. At1]MDV0445181.1 hypothetical protein [Methanimicrococcus sp. At1]
MKLYLNIICIFLILTVLCNLSIASDEDNTFSIYTPEYEKLDEMEKKKINEASDQWYEDHTFNVTVTKIFTSNPVDSKTTELIVEEIYESNDLKFKKMFNSSSLSSVDKYLVDSTPNEVIIDGKAISLKTHSEDIFSSEKTLVMTTESDPYNWKAYGYSYPDHLWKAVFTGYVTIYVETDPINLIWHNTSANQVKNTIITHSGWPSSAVAEYKYVVYDSGLGSYVNSTSVASNPLRAFGGYHVRIYPISEGYVVGGAHQDSQAIVAREPYYESHQIVNFESVERQVAGYFKSNYGWSVSYNSTSVIGAKYYSQDYGYPSVYNNGNATLITKV